MSLLLSVQFYKSLLLLSQPSKEACTHMRPKKEALLFSVCLIFYSMWLVKNATSAIATYCGTISCCVSMKTTQILVKWLCALLFDTLFSFINQHFLFHSNLGSLDDLIFLITSHQVNIQSLFPHLQPLKRLLPVFLQGSYSSELAQSRLLPHILACTGIAVPQPHPTSWQAQLLALI